MREYYNPHKYPVSFTAKDGGRMMLSPAKPGKKPQTVTGDYYESLVERGMLAVWNKEAAEVNKQAYLREMTFRMPRPTKSPTPPLPRIQGVREMKKRDEKEQARPEDMVEVEEAPKKVETKKVEQESPRVEQPKEETKGKMTKEELQLLTVRELKAIAEAQGSTDTGKMRKAELIDEILKNL